MKEFFQICIFAFLFCLIQAKTLPITRQKRDYESSFGSMNNPDSPYGKGTLNGFYYPKTPLAPFPNEDPSRRFNQEIVHRGSNSNLESSVRWSPSQQYEIKNSRTYGVSSTPYKPIYPSLNNAQNWNQSQWERINYNQGSYNRGWNQTYPSSSSSNYYDNNRNYNQGTYNQGTYNRYNSLNQNNIDQNAYGTTSNQWNQTKTINPWLSSGVHSPPWSQSYSINERKREFNEAYTNTQQPSYLTSKLSSDALKNSPEYLRCFNYCTSSTNKNYAPVCGSNLKTYTNSQELECAKRCGIDVRFAYNGSC